jgi:hypothetical protein
MIPISDEDYAELKKELNHAFAMIEAGEKTEAMDSISTCINIIEGV